ncbi:MAG: hypothetical protein A3D65_06060 [Candidatus Lloydbacteria bacterium RIFCSPHIGHO2_02_FULL_50_13]|uniref:Uncharacterized protein n=1 Tax=Candidatus Lloydbacteria bacterium RIFCSPHIGHO2_02_FULL_50_13 TaxID=1798661 RepID=A0A1G2D1I7_9BACT|nr:MAG: hypothetical protein A3D65_06060 [Candidatus Lloydbacteria bacterium RIFCSPHIGHO2_02_FULL_50_13]
MGFLFLFRKNLFYPSAEGFHKNYSLIRTNKRIRKARLPSLPSFPHQLSDTLFFSIPKVSSLLIQLQIYIYNLYLSNSNLDAILMLKHSSTLFPSFINARL